MDYTENSFSCCDLYLPSKISSLVRRLVASFVKKSLIIEIVDTFSVLNVASPLLQQHIKTQKKK